MVIRPSWVLPAIAVALVQPRSSAQETGPAPAVNQVKLKKGEPIRPDGFDALVRLILPDAERGETKWTEVAWMTDTLEARKKAAAEDKPVVVWTMSACPLGGD